MRGIRPGRRGGLAGLALVAAGVVLLLALERAVSGGSPSAQSSGLAPAGQPPPEPPAVGERAARQAYGSLPLSFVPNAGQNDRRVRYSAQAGDTSFFFTRRGAVVALAGKEKGFALRLGFLGADRRVAIGGQRRVAGRVNYLLGRDRTGWHTNLPTYHEVVYRQLWPGIDLRFRGSEGQLKYELEVAPGASVDAIRLAYAGASGVSLDRDGDLLLRTPLGTFRDTRPISYQPLGGKRVPVRSRFVLAGGGRYGFGVGAYDRRLPLIIDPGLQYSTYLGGSSFDSGSGIAVDAAGSAYVTGETDSTDFPTTSGAVESAPNGDSDAFVTKLNRSGTGLVYTTYLGGGGDDIGNGIAVDPVGSAYVTGETDSTDFPTTSGAFEPTNGRLDIDAFVAKLDATGSALLYSTYLGGRLGDETGGGIAVDPAGNAYVTGETDSDDFPTTLGAFQPTYNDTGDAFVSKLNPGGSALAYSTYLGGTDSDFGRGIVVDATGAYVTGETASSDFPTTPGAFDPTLNSPSGGDAFVTKLNMTGSGLVYSTYLGGSASQTGFGIAVDPAGSAYVTGETGSSDFPTTAGAIDPTANGSKDAFVTKLNPAGSALAYSTYLGGSLGAETGRAIAVDTAGSAHVTGDTDSGDFPTTLGALDPTANGNSDAFVTKLNPSGSALAYSTYLGGTNSEDGNGIAVDPAGGAYVTGQTESSDYPTTVGAPDPTLGGSSDAFVTKLDVGAPATLTLSPASARDPAGTTHTVTATVTDAAGQPAASVVARFTVGGSVTTSDQCTTGAGGKCSFSYQGPAQAGSDTLSAYADSNNNTVQDAGEPTAEATKTWTALPRPVTKTLTTALPRPATSAARTTIPRTRSTSCSERTSTTTQTRTARTARKRTSPARTIRTGMPSRTRTTRRTSSRTPATTPSTRAARPSARASRTRTSPASKGIASRSSSRAPGTRPATAPSPDPSPVFPPSRTGTCSTSAPARSVPAAGTWALNFDSSEVGLTGEKENRTAAAFARNGAVYAVASRDERPKPDSFGASVAALRGQANLII